MQNKESFGEVIRNLRERAGLPIRKVAAVLDIDPSTLSKIERNERSPKKEHIIKLAELFHVEESLLLVTFLSDKICSDIFEEACSTEVLKLAEEKIRYRRQKSQAQKQFNFE